ncbi:hypothetical protein [Oceanicella sp. SM1341]|uniref:hypothetical protein n=1 Tax=Oceanicella sp. SM1341 TaxID=1548889 RepID=UPI000E49DD34|nr:hypothetical protein [Oceanicella sp. SM1341]
MKFAIATTAAALALGVTAAGAADWSFEDADANGDGALTLEEVQVIYPSVDEIQFNTYDGNADKVLDQNEFVSLKQAMSTNDTRTQSK